MRSRVRIHGGLRSIGVSALRTSNRSSLRPSGAIVTPPGYPRHRHTRPRRDPCLQQCRPIVAMTPAAQRSTDTAVVLSPEVVAYSRYGTTCSPAKYWTFTSTWLEESLVSVKFVDQSDGLLRWPPIAWGTID